MRNAEFGMRNEAVKEVEKVKNVEGRRCLAAGLAPRVAPPLRNGSNGGRRPMRQEEGRRRLVAVVDGGGVMWFAEYTVPEFGMWNNDFCHVHGATNSEGVPQRSPGFPPQADTLGFDEKNRTNPERVPQNLNPSAPFVKPCGPDKSANPITDTRLHNPYRVGIHHGSYPGLLRNPGLCCATPSALKNI